MPESSTIELERFNRAMETLRLAMIQANEQVAEEEMPLVFEQEETIPTEENLISKSDRCACETCKMDRFEGSKLRHAVIHEYSYVPSGDWKLKSVGPDDPFKYYLGVELETDAHAVTMDHGRRREEWSKIIPEVAADMRRPKNFWVPKHDGSVSGPEFASHPATLTYWQKHRGELEDMFKMLLHAGYRSHDNDTCGMHVNISRVAFDTPAHLFRFLTLIHANPKWALKMSQRSQNSADHWANVSQLENVNTRAQTCSRMFPNGGTTGHGRYLCLNAPAFQPRFEFRLPRGTLRIDRFFKNLEWTVGMIEFARHSKVADCIPNKFMDWALDNEPRYPDLAGFVKERFSETRARREVEPIVGNVPNDDSMVVDQRPESIRGRQGGPRYHRDPMTGQCYYDEPHDVGGIAYRVGDRVRSTNTYIDWDGVLRFVTSGNRVTPRGTRSRPDAPETYRDVREWFATRPAFIIDPPSDS